MAEMSMNKAIHAAFRRDLDRFDSALESLSDDDQSAAARLRKAWGNFNFQLNHHHLGEHDIAWPALRSVGVSDQLLGELDAEHDVMASALREADSAMNQLGSPGAAARAATALSALRTAMVAHLEHEEAEIEPVYLAQADSPAMKEMGKKFSRVPLKQGAVFMAWVQDGADDAVMAGLKASVPGPVLTLVPMIFGRSYRRDVATAWRAN